MKVLVATYPYAGHFNPTQPVVCELVRRGHEVVWMTGPAYEARVRQTGARFAAMSADALIDDANIHHMEGKITLAKVADYLRRMFLDRIPAQVRDYDEVVSGGTKGTKTGGEEQEEEEEGGESRPFAADVLVVDFCTYAARCYMDLTGLPYATLGINPLVTLDPEIPPWGSGEQPPRSAAGRLRNRVRHTLGIVFFISRLSAALNRQRRALGLPPRSRWRSYADDVRSPDLHVMTTTRAFEFPRKKMLSSVVFVGPLLPSWLERPGLTGEAKTAATENATDRTTVDVVGTSANINANIDGVNADTTNDSSKPATEEWTTPPWWDEMLAHPRERVVHLTQGTIAVNTDLLVKPTVEALADREDLLVVITGKNVDSMFEGWEDPTTTTAAATAAATATVTTETTTATTATTMAASGKAKIKRPANVRTAAFVPHLHLLPHVGVMVTNAGYNGVLAALSCGVPLVCAGRSEDKADVSSRVAWSGAGIDLATGAPTAAAVRAAVLRIVDGKDGSHNRNGDPLHPPGHDYRAAAGRIRDDFARHNGPAEAVDALEALARRKAAEKLAKMGGKGEQGAHMKTKKKLQPKSRRDSTV